MSVFEELNKRFELEHTKAEQPLAPVVPAEPLTDTEQARKTMNELIAKGSTAIDDIINIAKQTDHPRAYEVVGQLIKTVSDVAKDLVNVQKAEQELNRKDPVKINTQNNVFVGSTHELMKMLKNTAQDVEVIEAKIEPTHE